MANKKVSQLTSKPSVLTTDLFPIADPLTGQLYKTTISDLGTAIGSGVSSVNGLVGAVVLDTDDIQELVSPTNKWFTDTRARAALSASSPLTYNSGTGVFGIQVATGSQNGYLSSTDWTTFNNKIGGSGITDYYARFTDTKVVSDGFIRTTSNITYVEGMGLSTGNGLDIEGNYGAGGGGLKIRSYDETTGNAYIDFSNTGGRMYLGVNRSTASGLMTNATAYATVLTTGLGTTNLEFGTNATKRLTIDGASGGVGIGTDSLTGYNLRVSKNLTGASNSYGILQDSTIQSDVTNAYINTSNPSIAASSTIGSLYHYRAFLPSIGAGSTINAQYGFSVQSSMTGAAANYGFWGGLASASGVWNIYMSGSANNYLSGNLLIGSSTDNSYKLQVTGDVDIAKNDRANGAVLRLTNSFNGSGWIAGDIIGSLIFYSSDTSAPANRGALRSISESGSTNSSITGLSFETYSSSVLSQKMYLTGAGNLLIGSTADNGSKLQVTGAATFSSSVTAGGDITMSGGNRSLISSGGFLQMTSTSGAIYLSPNSSTAMTLTTSGNVGIGTTSPGRKLQINVTPVSGEDDGINVYNGSSNFLFTRTASTYTYRGVAPLSGMIYSEQNVSLLSDGGNVTFHTNGGERMRITSGGNVGIGTTSPTTYGLAGRHLELNDAGGGYSFIHNNTTNVKSFFASDNADGSAGLYTYSNHFLKFGTNNTERMRITSGGDVLIGTTSDGGYKLDVNGKSRVNSADGFYIQSGSQYRQMYFDGFSTLYFWNGSNQANLSSAGAWVNASDATIKKDVTTIKYGLSDLMLLNPCSYKMKTDDLEQIGFIAQEVEQIIPEVVNSDNRGMKGLSYGNMVALLTKSIQELKAELDTLKNK